MKYIILICMLISGVSYGKEITIKNLFQIKSLDYDQELVDFFPSEQGLDKAGWVVVREAAMGMMQNGNRIKILEIANSKVKSNTTLFESKGKKNIKSIYKTATKIIIVAIKKYKSIDIYEFDLKSKKSKVFSLKLNIKNGYIQSTLINSKSANEIYLSYVESGLIKIILMDYMSGAVIWSAELLSNEGRLGSVVDMIESDGDVFLAGVISSNAKTKGWLGRISKDGNVTWQKVMNEERVQFLEVLLGSQINVLQEDTEAGELFVEPLNNLLFPKENIVPFLVSGYGNYIPWVSELCVNRYLLINKKTKGKDISLSASIVKYKGKKIAEKLAESDLFKIQNGTFINFIPKYTNKLYLGDSFIYIDADRKLRSGIEFSEIIGKEICEL